MLTFKNANLTKHIAFYMVWFLVLKLLSVIWGTLGVHSIVTFWLLTVLLFLPFGLEALRTAFCFVKSCFNGSIRRFSLDYAEPAIIVFVLFYVAYFNFLKFFVDWYGNALFYIFGLDSGLAITPFKRFALTYCNCVFCDADSILFFLFLPLCIVLLMGRLKLERCAGEN